MDLPLEFELSLPPTGGDFDYVDSREIRTCPACGARIELSVRTWLGHHPNEVRAVTTLPPLAHPRAPYQMQLSPDGRTLALYSALGPWLLGPQGSRSLPPAEPDPTRLESGCPRMAWSPDGRLLLEDGRILDADGVQLEASTWRHDGLTCIGWLNGAVATSWRDLELRPDGDGPYRRTKSVWVGGVDGYGSSSREGTWEMDSGFVMSGLVRFLGSSVLRMAPAFHGSSSWSRERWNLDQDGLHRMSVQSDGAEILAMDAEGDALVAILGEWTPDGTRCSVAWMNEDTLAIEGELPMPPGMERYAGLLAVRSAGPDRVLLRSGDQIALVAREGAQCRVERAQTFSQVRCLAASAGVALIATEHSLTRWEGETSTTRDYQSWWVEPD